MSVWHGNPYLTAPSREPRPGYEHAIYMQAASTWLLGARNNSCVWVPVPAQTPPAAYWLDAGCPWLVGDACPSPTLDYPVESGRGTDEALHPIVLPASAPPAPTKRQEVPAPVVVTPVPPAEQAEATDVATVPIATPLPEVEAQQETCGIATTFRDPPPPPKRRKAKATPEKEPEELGLLGWRETTPGPRPVAPLAPKPMEPRPLPAPKPPKPPPPPKPERRSKYAWPDEARDDTWPPTSLTVYTDGSGLYGGNAETVEQAQAAIGVVVCTGDVRIVEVSECFGEGTNNDAELRAISRGLFLAHALAPGVPVLIVSDSEWAIGACRATSTWNIANATQREIIRKVRLHAGRYTVGWKHVKGHQTLPADADAPNRMDVIGNHRADELAGTGRKRGIERMNKRAT